MYMLWILDTAMLCGYYVLNGANTCAYFPEGFVELRPGLYLPQSFNTLPPVSFFVGFKPLAPVCCVLMERLEYKCYTIG